MQKLSTFRGCGFERLRSIFNKTIAFIKNVCNVKKRRKIAFSQKKCPNTCFLSIRALCLVIPGMLHNFHSKIFFWDVLFAVARFVHDVCTNELFVFLDCLLQ